MRALKHRSSADKKFRRQHSQQLSRKMLLEPLEERRVFACDYSVLANDLQAELQDVQSFIKDEIETLQSLPLIGDKIGSAGTFLDDLASQLSNKLMNLEDDVLEPLVKTAIVEALGEDGLNLLGNHDGNPNVIDEGDVDVQITNTANQCSVEIGMHLTRDLFAVDLPVDAKFDLGLPALPFSVGTQGGITAAVGFDWPDFRFTLDSNDGLVFDLSPVKDLTVNISAGLLPGTELTADIGFLHAKVTDGVVLEEDGVTQTIQSEFTAAIDVGLGYDANDNFEVTIDTDTEANIALHINAMIEEDFPSISGDFLMHWDGFEEGSAEPTVELKNITIDVGGYISEVLSPIVNAIKDVAEPLLPAVEFVTEPIPVLSDLSNAVGFGDVTLLSLSEVADDYIPKSGYTEILEIVQIVVQVVDIANMFEDPAGPSLLINVGDLLISNDDNGDLRDQPPAKSISDFQNKMTELSADPQNFVNLKNAIEGSDLPDEIKGPLTSLIARFSSGIYYEFPILDNPLTEIGKLLLGQDSTLISFTADVEVQANAQLSYPIWAGIDAKIDGVFDFDGQVTIGYDTFGLRKFISKGIENNGGFDGDDLLDGIFIKSDSKVHLDGGFDAGISASYLIFDAQVTGGVTGGFHLDMPDESDLVIDDFNDNDSTKIRPFSELGNCLFSTDGSLEAGLKVKVHVGVGDLAWEDEFVIGETEIASFDVGCVPNPFRAPPAPNLATLNPDTGELTLHVGDQGSLRANWEAGQINEEFKVTPGIPYAEELANPVDGDLLVVSAYGMSERFAGVTKIIANAGNGNDRIRIVKSGNPVLYPLTAEVELKGEGGNDLLIYEGTGKATIDGGLGDDGLYGGDGQNTILGGDGFDTLKGGASANLLNGGNQDDIITGGSGPNQMGSVVYKGVLLTEGGNDKLIGGSGPNFIRGGAGNDILTAGPMTDDLDGGMGDDHLSAGPGSAKLFGSRGNDYITWEVGDGIPLLVDGGGSELESNTLGLVGTDEVETLALSKDPASTQLRISGLTSPWYFASNIQNVVFEGQGAADQILVSPLTGTSVRSVGLNLGDVLKDKYHLGDGAIDEITVLGNQTADSLVVEKELAVIKPVDPFSGSGLGIKDPLYGGITKITGMPTYTVRLANVKDDLLVTTRDGADTVTVKSITGPTEIQTGAGNDTLNVLAKDPGVPGSEMKLPDYPLALVVNAGTDTNKLIVDQSASLIPVNVNMTTAQITSELLPAVNFTATGGNYLGGIQVKTGAFADSVNVRSTLTQVPVSVNTAGGNDLVRVGSDAPASTGHLGFIRGPLAVEGGEGQNFLLLIDRDSPTGNSNAVVTANQVLGFAGPSNNIAVQYQATLGQMTLGLSGSEVAADLFQLISPKAFTQILGNGGDDQVQIRSLTQPAAIGGGNGNDVVEVGAFFNSLDNVLGMVQFYGQAGIDTLNVNDKSASVGQTFNLNSTSVQRVGTGNIQFDASLEKLNVSAGGFNDVVQVQSMPLTATSVALVGSAGVDKLVGPAGASVFEITGNGAGILNAKNLAFTQFENLQGGAAADVFRMLPLGQISQIDGGGSSDQINYAGFNNAVIVNLQAKSATGVGSFNSIERFKGSTSPSTMIGPNLPNLWKVNATDLGVINTMALGPISFESFGHLTGGTGTDGFQFGPTGFLSGRIQEQGVGTSDQLNYSLLTTPVNVNLQLGTASRVALGVAGVEQVTGGSGDDLLMGNGANNVLNGGAGNDVLVGQLGDDTLDGGTGNDVLIGGYGADKLSGGIGQDLLIANRTAYDTNVSALMAMIAEWKNSLIPYGQRVLKLRTGFGANNAFKLNTSNVLEDQAVDTLLGGTETDWFWGTPIAPFKDTISDQVAGEFLN